MIDMLRTGQQWLADKQREYMGQRVFYLRGSSAVRIPATLARSEFEDTGDDQSLVRYESRDYLIHVEDLMIDGILTQPAAGDQIVEGFAATSGVVFEVMSIPGEGVFRWSDQNRIRYRVHTKYVKTLP